jgi:hypothetical protein
VVGKELMHFCNARRTEVMWEFDCRRKGMKLAFLEK